MPTSVEYLIAKDSSGQAVIGGESNAQSWYDSKDASDNIFGKGKGNAITIRFATGGSLDTPTWGLAINLGAQKTGFNASALEDGIDAGFTYDNEIVVLVEVIATIDSDSKTLYAVIGDDSFNEWRVKP